MQEKQKIIIAKVKKVDMGSKILLDPSSFCDGFKNQQLPEIHQQGLIISLKIKELPLAKMNYEGTLKVKVKYEAQILILLDRYIEVKVVDQYGDAFVGTLFGVTVKGKGGQGQIRACKVLKIQNETIIVEGIGQGGNPQWIKLSKQINQILKRNKGNI